MTSDSTTTVHELPRKAAGNSRCLHLEHLSLGRAQHGQHAESSDAAKERRF